MYEIIATEDFISLIKEIPIKYLSILTRSFISINYVEYSEKLGNKDEFLTQLIKQIDNKKEEEI